MLNLLKNEGQQTSVDLHRGWLPCIKWEQKRFPVRAQKIQTCNHLKKEKKKISSKYIKSIQYLTKSNQIFNKRS